MQISFGDDAFDAFVDLASQIRKGYTVALLSEGEEPSPGEIVFGTDVRFLAADHDGVQVYTINSLGEPITGVPTVVPWNYIDRIHVY
jgi:hypothetical protein